MINYEKLLSKTAVEIKPSGIRKFFDLAATMKDCISLGVGEPDFNTPWHIRNEGIRTLQIGKTKYTANAGLAALREEISAYMSRRFGLNYSPESQVLVTVGGSEGIDVALRALIDPGDEVLIPEPSFVCYKPLTELAGGVAVPLPTYEKDDFRLLPETVKAAITEKTKVLIMPFPNNPTGAVMSLEDYNGIAAVLKDTNIAVISDEIYNELTYTKTKSSSFANADGMYERTIVINGFSKAYSMTGWRMGYICAPAELVKIMVKLHQFGIMSAPTTSQYAAIEALKNGDDDIEEMKGHYNMRRLFLLDAFKNMGIHCFEPLGAFYVFPNVGELGLSSEEFCKRFLEEYRVAIVPGNAFGDSGEGFVRISYAYSLDHLNKAMDRLDKFVTSIKRGN